MTSTSDGIRLAFTVLTMKKTTKGKDAKKLLLTTDTVRELQPAEVADEKLRDVAGGISIGASFR